MKRYVVCRPLIGRSGVREMRMTESDTLELPKRNLRDLRKAHPKQDYWIYDRYKDEKIY